MDQLLETASRLMGDLLAITGDLVDGSPDCLGPHVARLNRIKTRHGTYFVSGNHDFYSGWGPWKDTLQRLGWQVLDNRRVELPDGLQLLGVDDYGHPGGSERAYDLEAATAGLDAQRPSVLLAHQPVNLDAVAAKGIGLQLSGHTHGGQMFPATLVAQLMWREGAAGLSRHGQDTWCYTSRGCGFVGPPMRVAAPAEVVKLVLTSA